MLLLCGLLLFCAPAVQAQEDLMTLSSHISNNLQNLKVTIKTLNDDLHSTTLRLETVSESLRLSEQTLTVWKERLTKLSISLNSINEALNDSYTRIESYRNQVQRLRTLLWILIVILLIRIIGMIAGYILYIKNVKLPRWLDILL